MYGVPKGIRTPVTAVKGRCPRPLDDGDSGRFRSRGGARRDRTADLLHAMQALSQLSYSPTEPRTLRTRVMAVKEPACLRAFARKTMACESRSGHRGIAQAGLADARSSISSIACWSRDKVLSRPTSHTVTSIGGDTGPLVTATRIG